MEVSEKAIVTYGRSLMSVVAARSLKKRGIEITGVDALDYTAIKFSHYCDRYEISPDFTTDPAGYVKFLADLASDLSNKGDVPVTIMPMFRDAKLLSHHRDMLGDNVFLAAPDEQAVDRVHPKTAFHRFSDEKGLSVPRTIIVEETSALDDALSDIGVPCVIKPSDGVGGRGITFCDDIETARSDATGLLNNGDAVLVQEPAPGDDFCVTIIADDGALKAISAYTNLSTFPRDGGAGAMRKTVDHAPFEKAVAHFVEAAAWNGVGEIDFRWTGDANDEPLMIEVNPRFWAGLFHSISSGVDFPWMAYCQAQGKPIDFDSDAVEIGNVTKTPVIWATSAIGDVASAGFDVDRFASVLGQSGESIRQGKFLEAVNNLKSGLDEAVSFDDAMFKLFARMDQSKGAPGELSDSHDPFVGLGALFIASSLMRDGKLPDEVKF